MSRSLLPRNAQLLSATGDLRFSSRELAFELLVTKAILRSLEIDQILYVVLSGITSGDGLGFNRAVLLLADEGQRWITTRMAIGPVDAEDAHRIWEAVEALDLSLESLLPRYDLVREDPDAHRLTHVLEGIKLNLTTLDAATQHDSFFPAQSQHPVPVEQALAYALRNRTTLDSHTVEMSYEPAPGDPRFLFKDWWIVPLLTADRIVGVLIADSPFAQRRNHDDIEALLIGLTNLTTIAIEKSLLFQQLQYQVNQDGLTGAASRRFYDSKAAELLLEARQTGHPLSLILIDVDFFKQYNDSHGHVAGDEALKAVAKTLIGRSRSTDLVARYGGEEFTILLPNTTITQAQRIAQDLVDEVRRLHQLHKDLFPITISAGVTCTRGRDPSIEQVFVRADQAMYDAKHAGRDRVRFLAPVPDTPPSSRRLSTPPSSDRP